MIGRRNFPKSSARGLAGFALSRIQVPKATAQARTVDAHIEVLLNQPLGAISPNLYGHFTENLGGVIYDGIWVGVNWPPGSP